MWRLFVAGCPSATATAPGWDGGYGSLGAVGESHYQPAIRAAAARRGLCRGTLMREPENPLQLLVRQENVMSRISVFLSLILIVALPLFAADVAPNGASLRAADAEQMRIIVEGDFRAQQLFMHPNYIINGPSNELLRKPLLVKMLSESNMASDRFERVIEGTAITGNVGIVMGREVVHPLPTSQLGTIHGGKTLNRRFTNVFLFEKGKWRFLARQATIVD